MQSLVSGFFHFSTMLSGFLYVVCRMYHYFILLSPNNISLHGYSTFCLCIHQWTGILAVSGLWLLWILMHDKAGLMFSMEPAKHLSAQYQHVVAVHVIRECYIGRWAPGCQKERWKSPGTVFTFCTMSQRAIPARHTQMSKAVWPRGMSTGLAPSLLSCMIQGSSLNFSQSCVRQLAINTVFST